MGSFAVRRLDENAQLDVVGSCIERKPHIVDSALFYEEEGSVLRQLHHVALLLEDPKRCVLAKSSQSAEGGLEVVWLGIHLAGENSLHLVETDVLRLAGSHGFVERILCCLHEIAIWSRTDGRHTRGRGGVFGGLVIMDPVFVGNLSLESHAETNSRAESDTNHRQQQQDYDKNVRMSEEPLLPQHLSGADGPGRCLRVAILLLRKL
mmetsp:Transcript_8313/g.20336  ORF Transcript_8313/g.20336 Transcript_8313/m.20336 type:complete len:207 (+) Transcript_8313:677-1297(+)